MFKKPKAEKPYKIKSRKPVEDPSVLTISNILGYDDTHNCIRLKNGYAAVVRIAGIDIVNYKPLDQEMAYMSYGAALQRCNLPHKMVFVNDTVDYSAQTHHLQRRMLKQRHPFLNHLLFRQILWLQAYEVAQSDRCGYEIFFGETAAEVSEAATQFAAVLQSGKNAAWRCNRAQTAHLLQILNQGVIELESEKIVP